MKKTTKKKIKKSANLNNIVVKITDKESIKITGKTLLKIYKESEKEKKKGQINIIFKKYNLVLEGVIKKVK